MRTSDPESLAGWVRYDLYGMVLFVMIGIIRYELNIVKDLVLGHSM